MGIPTMASHRGGGTRQGSLYNLTLSEVQSHLGESFQTMNLEELLKGLDANQEVETSIEQFASTSRPHREGSFSMPQGLREKTVQELWREIQDEHNKGSEARQLCFGELTLEDFLAMAGAGPEGSVKSRNYPVGNAGVDPWLNDLNQYNQMLSVNHQGMMAGGYLQPLGGGSRHIPDGMFSEGQMATLSDPQTPGRKQGGSSDVAVKIVERRQKRMIKNRESAARSRARKQAYTNELENKVVLLEKENEMLKKQKGIYYLSQLTQISEKKLKIILLKTVGLLEAVQSLQACFNMELS